MIDRRCTPRIETVRRLETVATFQAKGWPIASAAKSLKLRTPALREWLRRNAPDGAADALADYVE